MPEQRTLDNPNDIAIRETQKQQRLEQGATVARANTHQPVIKYDVPFTFRFRQIKNGSFSGLWELCAMKANGKVDEVITDADSLPEVLDAIGNIFANKGY